MKRGRTGDNLSLEVPTYRWELDLTPTGKREYLTHTRLVLYDVPEKLSTSMLVHKLGIPYVSNLEVQFFLIPELLIIGRCVATVKPQIQGTAALSRMGATIATTTNKAVFDKMWFDKKSNLHTAQRFGFNFGSSTIQLKISENVSDKQSFLNIIDCLNSFAKKPFPMYADVQNVQLGSMSLATEEDNPFCSSWFTGLTTTSMSKVLSSRLIPYLVEKNVLICGSRRNAMVDWLGVKNVFNLTVGEPSTKYNNDFLSDFFFQFFLFCNYTKTWKFNKLPPEFNSPIGKMMIDSYDLISPFGYNYTKVEKIGAPLAKYFYVCGEQASDDVTPSTVLDEWLSKHTQYVDCFSYKVKDVAFIAIDSVSNTKNRKWQWLTYFDGRDCFITIPSQFWHKKKIIQVGEYSDYTYDINMVSYALLTKHLKTGKPLEELKYFVDSPMDVLCKLTYDDASHRMAQAYSPWNHFTWSRAKYNPGYYVVTNIRQQYKLQTHVSTPTVYVKYPSSLLRTYDTGTDQIGWWARVIVGLLMFGNIYVSATGGTQATFMVSKDTMIHWKYPQLELNKLIPKGTKVMVSGHLINMLLLDVDINAVMINIYHNMHVHKGIRKEYVATPERNNPFDLWHNTLEYTLSLYVAYYMAKRYTSPSHQKNLINRFKIANFWLGEVVRQQPYRFYSPSDLIKVDNFTPLPVHLFILMSTMKQSYVWRASQLNVCINLAYLRDAMFALYDEVYSYPNNIYSNIIKQLYTDPPSKFGNRAARKLRGVLKYDRTNHVPINVLDIGAAPGAWTNYMATTYPQATIYPTTKKSGLKYDLFPLKNINLKYQYIPLEGLTDIVDGKDDPDFDTILSDFGGEGDRESYNSLICKHMATLIWQYRPKLVIFKVYFLYDMEPLFELMEDRRKYNFDIVKPATSRLTNGEMYVLATPFDRFKRDGMGVVSAIKHLHHMRYKIISEIIKAIRGSGGLA